jgi:hypothetical protein
MASVGAFSVEKCQEEFQYRQEIGAISWTLPPG